MELDCNLVFLADGPRRVSHASMAGRMHDGGWSDGGATEAEPETVVGCSNDRRVAELLQEIGVRIWDNWAERVVL